jgi:hypothetical protein
MNWLNLDYETVPALYIAIACIPVIGLAILLTGDILPAFAPIALLGIVLLTFYRIEYSLFALIGFVLLFDQFRIPGFYPYTFRFDYFRNLKGISYLPSFNSGVVNPIEIHFLFILFIWFLVLSIKKQFSFNRVTVWGSFLLLFGWLSFAFVAGIKSGGDFLTALWEVRALFYLALFFVTIPQVIQTRQQLKLLMWVIIAGITIKAFQGIARFVGLGFGFGGLPTLTNHEDPVFMVTLFVLLLGMWFYKVNNTQQKVLSFILLPLILGFFVAQRRAAMASLFVSLATFFVLLPGKKQWGFFKVSVPVLIVVLIYGAAFWNSNNPLGKPVQMVKSGIYNSKEDLSEEDYYSNLYRANENYNLAYTVRKHPVFGTGFGKKYEKPLELANINFSLRDYIPHNQILWIAVKTGGIGFFLFWLFFNCFAFQGTWLHKKIKSPYLKAICMMIVVAVINQMVVSYYDLQLTYYRNMIYLGTLMGLLPVLQELEINSPQKLESETKKNKR